MSTEDRKKYYQGLYEQAIACVYGEDVSEDYDRLYDFFNESEAAIDPTTFQNIFLIAKVLISQRMILMKFL